MTAADLNADPLPLARLLGVVIAEASPERVVARLTVRRGPLHRGGVLHGGAFMALADTAGAIGAYLNLPAGARTTTIESKTNFLGAAPWGPRSPPRRARCIGAAAPRSGRPASPIRPASCLALVTQTQLVI